MNYNFIYDSERGKLFFVRPDESLMEITESANVEQEFIEVYQAINNLREETTSKEQFYSAFPVETASGAIVSITDGADNIPLKSCVVTMLPIQEGTGDPSPENVRPISGYDSGTVWGTGINVWDEVWEEGAIAKATGENVVQLNSIRSKNYISVKAGESYYLKSTQGVYVRFYDADKVYLGSDYSVQNKAEIAFTVPDNARFIRFYSGVATYGNDISITHPSTDHDYHAYTGASYHSDFPSTVYGGTWEVMEGRLQPATH